MTSRNYCFTLFDSRFLEKVDGMPMACQVDWDDMKGFRYITFQMEKCPDSKRYHLQGYIEFKEAVRMTVFQKFLGTLVNEKKVMCHMEKRKGSQSEAIEYCTKLESRITTPFEMGAKAPQGVGGFRGNDLIGWIKANQDKTRVEYIEEFTTEFLRYNKGMMELWNMYKKKEKSFHFDSLLPIQNEMLDLLESQTDRNIEWIYDKKGSCGKSELANYLCDKGDTFWCSGGGYNHIFHAYNKDIKPVVVIDLMRAVKGEHVPYEVIEAFKTGKAFSSKYDSTSMTFKKVKLIVLSNRLPDTSKLTDNRWRINEVTYSSEMSRGGGNTSPTPTLKDVTKNILDSQDNCQISLDLDI